MKKYIGLLVVFWLMVCTSACTTVTFMGNPLEKQSESDAKTLSAYVEEETLSDGNENENDVSLDADDNITDEKDDSELLSVEEVMKELEGEYINNLFIEEFKRTKSILYALEYRESVAIRNESDGYCAYIGDGHQGIGVGNIDSMDYVDGNYELHFEADENNGLKIVYNPVDKLVYCEMKSDEHSWSTEGEIIAFTRNDSAKNILSCILFDGIDGVDIQIDGVYAKVYDIYYKMDVMMDITGSDISLDEYSGGLYLSCDNGENVIMKYQYNDGKVSLYDMNDTHVVTFEQK